MSFILGLIGSGIGALFGAYLTNIFTWKIKNRIDALDIIYAETLNHYNLIVDTFTSNEIDKLNPYNPIRDIAQHYEKSLFLNCFIIDGEKYGELFNKLNNWRNLGYNILLEDRENESKVNLYENEFQISIDLIFNTRKELTSFSYMLKQINFFKHIYECLSNCCKNKKAKDI